MPLGAVTVADMVASLPPGRIVGSTVNSVVVGVVVPPEEMAVWDMSGPGTSPAGQQVTVAWAMLLLARNT